MRKLTLFIVASILFVGLTGCKHNVITEKKLYSKTQKNEAGEIVAVTKYDKRGNVIYKYNEDDNSKAIYEYDKNNRCVYKKVMWDYGDESDIDELWYSYNDCLIEEKIKQYTLSGGEESCIEYIENIYLDKDISYVIFSRLGITSYSLFGYGVINYEKSINLYPHLYSSKTDFDGVKTISRNYTKNSSNEYKVDSDNIEFFFKENHMVQRKYEGMEDILCNWDIKGRLLSISNKEYDPVIDINYTNDSISITNYYTNENRLYNFDENENCVSNIRTDLLTGEVEYKNMKIYDTNNNCIYEKSYSGGISTEYWYEYTELCDCKYKKIKNLDGTVTETVYTYDYEYY